MKLIDKDALVAEIERRNEELVHTMNKFYYASNYNEWKSVAKEYRSLVSFIDTLEVKEVDLEKEIGMFTTKQLLKKRNYSTGVFHITQADINNIAKHFFEVGLKTQKGK